MAKFISPQKLIIKPVGGICPNLRTHDYFKNDLLL